MARFYPPKHINNWPLEVLRKVFDSAEIDSFDDPARQSICPFPRLFSHVCQHWRTVALSYPAIWSEIHSVSGHSEWLAEVLRRSQGETLSLVLDLDGSTNAKNLLTILTHAPRVEMFAVQVVENDLSYLDDMKRALQVQMSALKYVRWTQESPRLSGPAPFQHKDDFPALKSLDILQDFMPDITSPLLHGLRSLRLNSTVTRISIPELFDVLRPLQELEELAIVLLMNHITGTDLTTALSNKVVLPKLTSLTVDDFWSTAVVFLTNLDIPSLSEFRCEWYLRGPETEKMADQVHGVHGVLNPILNQLLQDDFASACLRVGHKAVRFYTLGEAMGKDSQEINEDEIINEDENQNQNINVDGPGEDQDNDEDDGVWEDQDNNEDDGVWEDQDVKEDDEDPEGSKFALTLGADLISPPGAFSRSPNLVTFSMMVLSACAARVTSLELKIINTELDDFTGITQCLMLCRSLQTLVLDSLQVIVSVFPSLMTIRQEAVLPLLSTIQFSDVPEGSQDLAPGWEQILWKFLEWRKESGREVAVKFGSLAVSKELRAAWSKI